MENEVLRDQQDAQNSSEQTSPSRTSATDAESTQSPHAEGSIAMSLRGEAQCLIDSINEKRKQDNTLLTDMRKQLDLQVEKTCSSLEQHLYGIYDKQGKVMQEKLAELFATLDRISKLEVELEQFKQALGSLYQEVH